MRANDGKGMVIFGLVIVAIFLGMPCIGQALTIDIEYPSVWTEPQTLPVFYQFQTSWDGIQWTQEQKDSTRDCLDYLGSVFLDQPAFQELASPDDFTLRWAGEDFFKNYGGGTLNGEPIELNLEGALAVAAKNGLNPPDTWDTTKYPLNEIYFNTQYNWHYNPFTLPEEGDPDDDADGEFDFWSILEHETIHMLCVNSHSEDENAVMYAYFSDGERRWKLQESDLQLLRAAGYRVIPEPATCVLFCFGLFGLLAQKKSK